MSIAEPETPHDTGPGSDPAVLVVDDDPMTGALVEGLVGRTHAVIRAVTEAEAAAVLQVSPVGVLLCSEYLQREPHGLRLLARTRDAHPHTQLVLISESGGEELLTLAINEVGVLRYLKKPVDAEQAGTAVAEGLRHHRQSLEIERLQRDHREMAKELRGLSYRIRRFRRSVRMIMGYGRDLAVASATTLIAVQAMFLGVGVAVIATLYLLKRVLGLNILEHLHLQDLLGG